MQIGPGFSFRTTRVVVVAPGQFANLLGGVAAGRREMRGIGAEIETGEPEDAGHL